MSNIPPNLNEYPLVNSAPPVRRAPMQLRMYVQTAMVQEGQNSIGVKESTFSKMKFQQSNEQWPLDIGGISDPLD